MKRVLWLLTIAALLLSFCSCTASVSKAEMEATVADFTEALRVYDRNAMTELLTEFPDNSGYIYLDDIFNDEPYIELYQLLYKDISYEIVSYEKNTLKVKYTMADVKTLYTQVSSLVMNLAVSDENLQKKLSENDQNAIILVQEIMLSYAAADKAPDMTAEFTLKLKDQGKKTVIVCDDELRALITGNFFLSKNVLLEDAAD